MDEVNLFGFDVRVVFLVAGNQILAYAWHYEEEKARRHLEKIMKFHGLGGEMLKSGKCEEWLKERLKEVVIHGEKFNYKNREVYEELIRVLRGDNNIFRSFKTLRNKIPRGFNNIDEKSLSGFNTMPQVINQKGNFNGFLSLGNRS